MIKKLPPTEVLRALLRYEPETGFLYWQPRSEDDFPHAKNPLNVAARFNSQYAGKRAFTNSHDRGYLVGKVNNIPYYAHRVIWKIVYGTEPEKIDHLNGDTSANQLENLRSVDDTTNSRNAGLPKNNTSGVVGVYWEEKRGQWRARISDGLGRIHLGHFHNLADAIAARQASEGALGYHQNGRRTSPDVTRGIEA